MDKLNQNKKNVKIPHYIIILSILLSSSIVFAQDTTIYLANDANLFNAFLETKNEGYSDSRGYINFENNVGGYAEWKVFMAESDSQSVIIRFANGSTDNRIMSVSVNDIIIKQIDFYGTGAWINWGKVSVELFLIEGLNRIKFTGLSSDGGPNIDLISVTGEKGPVQHELEINTVGRGSVDVNPLITLYNDSSYVTLNAAADSGWIFNGWSGDLFSNENPVSLLMNNDKKIFANFIFPIDTLISRWDESPIGFASIDTLGKNGTTGGAGGDTIIVTTGEQLFNILDGRRDEKFNKNYAPLVLMVQGKLTWGVEDMIDIKGNYDLSIIGIGDNAQIEEFGLNVYKSFNIIIRNLEFRNCHDDAISISNEITHHVWVDHCTFSDDPESGITDDNHDGAIDIKDGANFVTISWNHFYNHRKTSLLGHSDNNGDNDIGRLKVTYHHNWFDNTNQRHPRVRFGTCHIFNNYYDNRLGIMTYGIASTMEADVVVEANYFLSVSDPTHVGQAASGPGDLIEFNNIYENSGQPEIRGDAFDPAAFYSYNPDNVYKIPELIKNYSGHGKFSAVTHINDIKLLTNDLNLYQNYPNPFNPTTTINYYLPRSIPIKLFLYNSLGEKILELVKNEMPAGNHSYTFDASRFSLSNGVYFYTLSTSKSMITKKMILIK